MESEAGRGRWVKGDGDKLVTYGLCATGIVLRVSRMWSLNMMKLLLSVVILFGFDHIHYTLFSFQWCIVAMTRLSLSELKGVLLGCMNFTSIFTLCLARKQLKFTSSGIITVVKRKNPSQS